MVDSFLEILTEKDKEIIRIRMEENCKQLGYKTHSAVLKRIQKIGQAYEHFAYVDHGFQEKMIIGNRNREIGRYYEKQYVGKHHGRKTE